MQKIIEERTAEIRGHGFFDFERSAYGTLELELEGVYAEHVEVVIGEMAENGMIVVCINLSAEDGSVITGPDIITRGFVYVKENEELLEDLREVAIEAIERCQRKRIRDWSTIKSAIKNDLSGYLYKTTKRNPMILPIIMEI